MGRAILINRYSILCILCIIHQVYAEGVTTLFGEKIIDEKEAQISFNFNYGISSNDVTTIIVGSGLVSPLNNMIVASTGTDASGSAVLQSNNVIQYKPGHEVYAYFTALFLDGGAVNSTQWIGLFDDADGLAVGYSGATFSLLYRNGGVDTLINQASFNRDRLDGTGDSGFILDSTTMNLFRVSYGAFGASLLEFEILSEQGEWIVFHVVNRINNQVVPVFTNAFLPMRMQATNNGNTSNVRIASAGWSAGVVKNLFNRAGHRTFMIETDQVVISTSAEVHLVTLMNKTTFRAKSNKIKLRIVAYGGCNLEIDLRGVVLRLYKNSLVSGTSFTDVNLNDSVAAFSTAGTLVSGNLALEKTFNFTASSQHVNFLSQKDISITLNPGESCTLTGQRIENGNLENIITVLAWEEYFA